MKPVRVSNAALRHHVHCLRGCMHEIDGEGSDALAARRLLALQYGARLSPAHAGFRWPSTDILLAVQDWLLADMIAIDGGDGRDDEKGVGDTAYRESYLKQLMRRLEDGVALQQGTQKETNATGEEDNESVVSEGLVEAYATLVASSTTTSQPGARTVKHFLPCCSATTRSTTKTTTTTTTLLTGWRAIRTVEEGTTITRGTTGLTTWEASLRLAGHLMVHRDVLRSSKTIVELGCGTGLLGTLVASMLLHDEGDENAHRRTVVLTDLDGPVLEQAQQTVSRHADATAHANVHVTPLDWFDVLHGDAHVCRWLDSLHAGLVIAADVVFEPALVVPLCAVLKRILSGGGGSGDINGESREIPVALLASTVRNPNTFMLLKNTLTDYQLSYEEVPMCIPMIDLRTLEIPLLSQQQQQQQQQYSGGNERQSIYQLSLFPSLHDNQRNGHVVLLKIVAEHAR